jgi:hypothetical protein
MTDTSFDYLMNICTVCYLVCYVPDLYGNWKNKNANCWNIPEKVLIFIGTGFALAYSVLISDQALIVNFAPLFILDGASLGLRAYYASLNRRKHIPLEDVAGSTATAAHESSAPGSNTATSSDGPTRETTGSNTPQV